MDMKITFPGGKKVNAEYNGFTHLTDQPVDAGGENSAPSPFELFLASLGTCAGFYVQSFCQQRGIDMAGIELRQSMECDPQSHLIGQHQHRDHPARRFPGKIPGRRGTGGPVVHGEKTPGEPSQVQFVHHHSLESFPGFLRVENLDDAAAGHEADIAAQGQHRRQFRLLFQQSEIIAGGEGEARDRQLSPLPGCGRRPRSRRSSSMPCRWTVLNPALQAGQAVVRRPGFGELLGLVQFLQFAAGAHAAQSRLVLACPANSSRCCRAMAGAAATPRPRVMSLSARSPRSRRIFSSSTIR